MACVDWNKDQNKALAATIGYELKIAYGPPKQSLGWVNVYKDSFGYTQLSSRPKPTKQESLDCRSTNPIGTYVGTIELFVEVRQ